MHDNTPALRHHGTTCTSNTFHRNLAISRLTCDYNITKNLANSAPLRLAAPRHNAHRNIPSASGRLPQRSSAQTREWCFRSHILFHYLANMYQFLPLSFRDVSPHLDSTHSLFARQTVTQSCPISNGGIAGVVLGTFFGTLLLVWFFSVITGPNQWVGRDEVVIEKRRRARRSSRSRSVSGVRRPSQSYSRRS